MTRSYQDISLGAVYNDYRIGLKDVSTKPYTPKSDGKVERFIRTALREWAYAIGCPTSDHRPAQLPVWLHRNNWHRLHGGLKSKPHIDRLQQSGDNLLRLQNQRARSQEN